MKLLYNERNKLLLDFRQMELEKQGLTIKWEGVRPHHQVEKRDILL